MISGNYLYRDYHDFLINELGKSLCIYLVNDDLTVLKSIISVVALYTGLNRLTERYDCHWQPVPILDIRWSED